MPELQITQEYLGQSVHLVFLATMWEEFLKSDTYQEGKGSTVARCTDGSLFPQKHTAIAGVANIGTDTNWCGHPLHNPTGMLSEDWHGTIPYRVNKLPTNGSS